MPFSPEQLDQQAGSQDSTLASTLAPEDVRVGDFVTLLQVTYEVPSYLWCADATLLEREVPVRLPWLPECGGMPLKVKAVCLPFVLVKLPTGEKQALDVRRCRLARLKDSYAAAAWKAYKNRKSRERIC